MAMVEKIRHIGQELRTHAPFTLLGAVTGISLMLLFRNMDKGHTRVLFAIFHPGHVVLSAIVTASLFQLHRKARDFIRILVIGYVGAIGIATLSDCIVPFLGESILGVAVPTHAAVHEHEHEGVPTEAEHEHDNTTTAHEHERETHRPSLHLGFIEEWYLVNPAAVLGVVIAFFLPRTRFPHALHVLISTWASSAHMLMNTQADMTGTLLLGMLVVLFIAVWLPCCVSDIVFPMLFVDASPNHGHCWLCRREDHDHDDQAAEAS
jgi:hypothetical protein